MTQVSLPEEMRRNLAIIQAHFAHTDDLVVRSIGQYRASCVIIYLESLVNPDSIQFHLFHRVLGSTDVNMEDLVAPFESFPVSATEDIGAGLLDGRCVILIEGEISAYLVNVSESAGRTVAESQGEQVTTGSHEGFVEQIGTNLNLIRRRIRNPNLKIEYFTLGKLTKTRVALVYMDKLAKPGIVSECRRRLGEYQADQLHSTGSIAEYLEEHPLSPFPQMLQTERPDRSAAYVMDGKIALLVDGSPTALLLPVTFFAFYQSPDDYNNRWIIGSFNRLVRMIGFVLAISLPAIYIAIVSFHSEVLPIGILYSVKVAINYVPFPPIMEAITMQIILELLKEAAIRLHSSIAQTIGVVGGLVIGTAIVETHLISHTMIVVIGLTAISSFVTPVSEFGTSLRVIGFSTILAATLFGFFGIAIMLMIVFIHLCKLDMFGEPYFSPFGPFLARESVQDTYFRLPAFGFKRLPWKRNYTKNPIKERK